VSNVRYEEIAIAEDFDTIRDRTAEAKAVWCRRAATYLPDAPPPSIVDIGAGTGIWSLAFAEALGVRVHAVEPSRGMRARAVAARPHPLVTYTEGSVERLPLEDDAVAAAWLSTVVHQFVDLPAAAHEIRRVVEPGGTVLIRGGYPGRQDEIELFHLFPDAMRLAETWPRLGRVISAFEDAGFAVVALDRVREPTFATYDEMLADLPLMRRSDTALVGIDDEGWAKGVAAVERARAAGETPWPLGQDLLVLR
jgi:ubiquinone/menaquinone biosynthesis C-methylase UbiE